MTVVVYLLLKLRDGDEWVSIYRVLNDLDNAPLVVRCHKLCLQRVRVVYLLQVVQIFQGVFLNLLLAWLIGLGD